MLIVNERSLHIAHARYVVCRCSERMKDLFLRLYATLSTAFESITSRQLPELHTDPRPFTQAATSPPRSNHGLQKRQPKVVPLSFSSLGSGSSFFVNVSIGTPPQTVTTYLDISSGDLWVPEGGAHGCTPPKVGYTFDPDSSTTYDNLTTPFTFNLTSIDNLTVGGYFATDVVGVGGAAIPKQEFAISNDTAACNRTGAGVLGIGYFTVQGGPATKRYANILEQLVDRDLINTPAYSIWTNNVNGSNGQLLFGGVDTEKYEGDLITVPMIRQPSGYTQLVLALTTVDVNGIAIDTNIAGEVTLDSGSTGDIIYLPEPMVQAIATALGGIFTEKEDVPIVNCTAVMNNATLGFTFTSARIAIPLSLLIDGSSSASEDDPGAQCFLSEWLRDNHLTIVD